MVLVCQYALVVLVCQGGVVSCRGLLVDWQFYLALGALHSLVLRTVAELVETSFGGQSAYAQPLWISCPESI